VRSIYTKTFLWFWLMLLGVTASVMLLTLAGGSQPVGYRWMSLTMNVCARGAVASWQQGGRPALERYMSDVASSSPVRAALLDSQGMDILGHGLPPVESGLLQKARQTGGSQFSVLDHWSGAVVVPTSQGNFIYLAQMYPLRGLLRPRAARPFLWKFAIAMLATALLCLIPTRHIADPIRALRTAACRIADGDLSVRASPTLSGRTDELADLARDFDRMAERIQSLLRKQQELLGNISHDLRSPLTRLNVSLELVRRGDADAAARMQQDLDHLDGMIAQILTLTRLQASEGQKILQRLNLRLVLESIAADAQFEGEKQGKSVLLSCGEDCWLDADPALLRSCLENVVRNALRYTKPETAVELSMTEIWRDGTSWLRIVVADRGEGVPPECLPRLFEPFYRVSPARDSGSGSAGLGLAIAQRVATLYGGSISARNRNQGGLEMEINLPVGKVRL